MKTSAVTLPVDGEKLRKSLAKRGKTLVGASEELGYIKVLKGVTDRGLITKPVMMLVDNVLGIPYDEYKPDEPKQEASLTTELIEKTIYDATIYAATYAVEKYLNEHLEEMIENAVRKVVG